LGLVSFFKEKELEGVRNEGEEEKLLEERSEEPEFKSLPWCESKEKPSTSDSEDKN
jgi:hypothetical protein